MVLITIVFMGFINQLTTGGPHIVYSSTDTGFDPYPIEPLNNNPIPSHEGLVG